MVDAAFPCDGQPFFIDAPAGPLEALTTCPPSARASGASAVICHPHPRHGGTMQNKVVHTLARAFDDLGCATVRFNFRGVGASQGGFANGDGETDDAVTVLQWLRARRPGDALWLAGFSFGAYVALRAAAKSKVAGLVIVAPPVNLYDFTEIETPRAPWVVVQGETDDVVPAAQVRAWCETRSPRPRLVTFPDAGHFFHQRLGPLRAAVVDAVRPLLPSAPVGAGFKPAPTNTVHD